MYNPQLETFLRVADAGSFNKAAEESYITPTAVIKQINLLEESLGVKLFDRSHRGLQLTKAGRSMYQDAKYIIQYCRDSVTRAKNAMQEDENIIRIGSAGSYTDKAKLFDVVLAAGAVSESNYARVQSGFEGDLTLPSQTLNDKLRASAAKQGIPLIEGNIHSSDVFYRQPSDEKPTYWEKLRDERGCLCVEMESFALFANAQVLGKNAACLLTISDSFVSPEITTAEQRQTSFTNMMKVALGAEY